MTRPNLPAVGSAGTAGYKAVAGVGIQVRGNGSAYPGTFLVPLTLTIRSSSITSTSVVVVWNGTAFVTEPGITVISGAAVVRFDTDRDFVVLYPLATTTATIPGATRAVTGKRFIEEGILACAVIVLGASGVAVGRRRSA
jgi:glutamate synthase domain-containing protein 3